MTEDSKLTVNGNFWAEGNYRRTTERVEAGYRQCGELARLVGERADVERDYSRALRAWAERWEAAVGRERGSVGAAARGLLTAADQRAELHSRLASELCAAARDVRDWQRDTYHRSLLQLRERRELEAAFKRVQRPWAKALARVTKAREDYHAAVKTERALLRQVAAGDSASPPDDRPKKNKDKVAKTRNEVLKCKEKYEDALYDLTNCNTKYTDEMKELFERCQKLEAQRLNFYKDTLLSLQKTLNLSQNPQLASIYDKLLETINSADPEADLKWWSDNHGVNMTMNSPKFEEYAEELTKLENDE